MICIVMQRKVAIVPGEFTMFFAKMRQYDVVAGKVMTPSTLMFAV